MDYAAYPVSYWLEYDLPSFPALTEDLETEIGVVGGGIVGVVAAYFLAKAGKKVVLIEAREVLSGVTGHTTAKISAQHGLIYQELMRTFGKEEARLYYEANQEGLDIIRQLSEERRIECDLEPKEATLYSTSERGAKQIEAEARVYETLGIPGVLTNGRVEELPFPTTAALTMKNQAQFHPVKFLSFLLNEIQRFGGQIFEQSRAVRLLKDETSVRLENGHTLNCEKVIVATHYPFNDFNGLYFSKLSISRSYAIAAKVDAPIPEAMYLSVDSPSHSLRSIRTGGEEFLLIGGEDHPTGKSKTETQEHYENLAAFGKRWFDLQTVPYHWSAQDMTTLDKVPYIGQMTSASSDILVATGFQKWGMAMGVLAARLLADLLLEEPNVYADLFAPTRGKFKTADLQQFAKKNAAVGKDFFVTKAKRPTMTAEDLQNDEGGLVFADGKKAGGYRDPDGTLHLVNTTCTHMGCGLSWNDAERSWDCACHGSRFSYSGEVLDGPAVKPLEKL